MDRGRMLFVVDYAGELQLSLLLFNFSALLLNSSTFSV